MGYSPTTGVELQPCEIPKESEFSTKKGPTEKLDEASSSLKDRQEPADRAGACECGQAKLRKRVPDNDPRER